MGVTTQPRLQSDRGRTGSSTLPSDPWAGSTSAGGLLSGGPRPVIPTRALPN